MDVANFRDFGGVPGRDGRLVRRDRLYRGAAPRAGSSLLDYDFAVIGDLRRPDEYHGLAEVWPAHWAGRLHRINGAEHGQAPHIGVLNQADLSAAAVHASYLGVYRALPFQPPYMHLFGRLIRELAATEGRVFIHCAAGKDRTGMLVAMIQHVLGVGRADIMADYLLSASDPGLAAMVPLVVANAARAGRVVPEATARAVLGVRAEYLEAALALVLDADGGMEGYLDAIGVTPAVAERLREALLV